MTESMFSGDDLETVLPESLRGLVVIDSMPLPAPIFEIVSKVLQAAVHAVANVAWVRRRTVIVFAIAPFRIKLRNGQLLFMPNPEVIHCHIEDMIFIDVNKLVAMPFAHQVATVLEELVHVLLNIKDENLVSVVVAHLYDGVHWVDGRYMIAGEQTPT